MKQLVFRLILAAGLVWLVYSYVGETAAIAVAALVIVAIVGGMLWRVARALGLTGRRGAAHAGGGNLDDRRAESSVAAGGKPAPPSRADFRSAGVRMDLCTRCEKPLNSVGYVFGLGGRPTIYCATCWSRATNLPTDPTKADTWWDRLTTEYEQRRM